MIDTELNIERPSFQVGSFVFHRSTVRFPGTGIRAAQWTLYGPTMTPAATATVILGNHDPVIHWIEVYRDHKHKGIGLSFLSIIDRYHGKHSRGLFTAESHGNQLARSFIRHNGERPGWEIEDDKENDNGEVSEKAGSH